MVNLGNCFLVKFTCALIIYWIVIIVLTITTLVLQMFSNLGWLETLMGGAGGDQQGQWLGLAATLTLAWFLFVSTMVGILVICFVILILLFLDNSILP